MVDHLRDRLGCSRLNLKMGMALLKQESCTPKDFARMFEGQARDAGIGDEDAKVLLVGSLNRNTLQRMDTYVTTMAWGGLMSHHETMTERLQRVPFAFMLGFLKQSHLTDIAESGAGRTALPPAPAT